MVGGHITVIQIMALAQNVAVQLDRSIKNEEMIVVHKVYYTQDGIPLFRDFSKEQMTDSLKFCEELRKQRIEGKDISFISIASEIPDCVSLPGVGSTTSSYNWKKRRK